MDGKEHKTSDNVSLRADKLADSQRYEGNWQLADNALSNPQDIRADSRLHEGNWQHADIELKLAGCRLISWQKTTSP